MNILQKLCLKNATINQLLVYYHEKKKHYNIQKNYVSSSTKSVCLKVYTTSPKKPNSAFVKLQK